MVQDELRAIRKQLRLAMNGVVSTSMREKGIVYKLNFGASLPEVREIAASHTPDSELAAALWMEDVRELKMLATYLQPVDDFPKEKAWQWLKEIPYLEIAEQCCRNLFWQLPYAVEWALELFDAGHEQYKWSRTVAFLLWAELFKHKRPVSKEEQTVYVREALRTITLGEDGEPMMERLAAVTSLKLLGRQSKKQALAVLDWVKNDAAFFATTAGQEMYEDLKFEFEFSGLLEE